jgi:serine/threonine protein kinase
MSNNFLQINDITVNKIPSTTGNNFIINMEYMDFPLPKLWERVKDITLAHKLRILYSIIKAVSELEDAGIVHTNLNPDHILLSEDLNTVKICGFTNNARQATDVLTSDEVRKIRTDPDGIIYRPMELICYAYLALPTPPPLTSAMDVWSIGCIFFYLLRNGEHPFVTTTAGYGPWGSVFTTLGNPTIEEQRNGLRIPNIWTLTSQRNGYDALKYSIPKYERLPVRWLELLDMMLDYNPVRRITIKQLLKHRYFWEFFKENPFTKYNNNPSVGVVETTLQQFQIHVPDTLQKWTSKERIDFVKSYIDTRREFVIDQRKNLVILAKNLEKMTKILFKIWLIIFHFANIRPSIHIQRYSSSTIK